MNNRFAQSDRDQLMMFSRTLGDNLDKNHEIYAFVKLLDTIDMNPFLCSKLFFCVESQAHMCTNYSLTALVSTKDLYFFLDSISILYIGVGTNESISTEKQEIRILLKKICGRILKTIFLPILLAWG